MTVNDINSIRTFSVCGYGYEWGTEGIDSLERFDEDNELLDEYDFEFEGNGDYESLNDGIEFDDISLILRNNDTGEEEIYEQKDFEKLGIKVNGYDPDKLKQPSKKIDHSKLTDKDYYLEIEEGFKGIWGQLEIKKGEIFDFKKVTIEVEFYSDTFISKVSYDGVELEDYDLEGKSRSENLKVR